MTMERTVSRMIMTTVIQMVIPMERIPYGILPQRVLLPVSMAKVEQEVRKEHQLPDLFPAVPHEDVIDLLPTPESIRKPPILLERSVQF